MLKSRKMFGMIPSLGKHFSPNHTSKFVKENFSKTTLNELRNKYGKMNGYIYIAKDDVNFQFGYIFGTGFNERKDDIWVIDVSLNWLGKTKLESITIPELSKKQNKFYNAIRGLTLVSSEWRSKIKYSVKNGDKYLKTRIGYKFYLTLYQNGKLKQINYTPLINEYKIL